MNVFNSVLGVAYVISTALFILSLHWLSDPKLARRGVMAGVIAMAVAVLATWARPDISQHTDLSRHLWVRAGGGRGVF